MFSIPQKEEILRLYGFMKPRAVPYLTGLFGNCVIKACFSVAVALVTKFIIDAAEKGDIELMLKSALAVCLMVIIYSIFSPLLYYMSESCVEKTMKDIQITVFKHIQKLPLSFYEKNHSGDIISRVNFDVSDIAGAYSYHLRRALDILFPGVFSAIVLFSVEWKLGIVVIILGIASTYVNKQYSPIFRELNTRKFEYYGKLTEKLIDFLAGIRTMKIFHIEDILFNHYSEYNDKATAVSRERGRRHAIMEGANAIMGHITFVTVIGIGAFMVYSGWISFSMVVAIILILNNVSGVFLHFETNLALAQRSLSSAERVFQILDIPEEPERYQASENVNYFGKAPDKTVIEFKDVSFQYEDNNPVLKNISFTVEKGKTAGLVGFSGGGKSTIIKLLLGYYPITSGEILIAGRLFSHYTLEEIRELIAYVPQEAYLFDDTIEQNIRYGKVAASTEEIIEAAKAAKAHEFILEQKDGYATIVGERGVRLSGGQRQRIAIARAILKNSPILLLDEATSSLDSENEKLVQEALDNLMKNRTSVAIAHRLSTIENADIIYVMDDGSIAAKGNHKELMSDIDGIYSNLYRIQYRSRDVAS